MTGKTLAGKALAGATGVLLAVAIAAPALAKDKKRGSELINSVIQCSEIADATARVNCYDVAVRGLKQARAENVSFDEEGRQPHFTEINSTITSVAELERGKWLMVLADHSVWATKEVSRIEPERGATIQIKKGSFAGYRAAIGRERPVPVQRLR